MYGNTQRYRENPIEFPITQKALRADDANLREDVVCRKRPRSARECVLHIFFKNHRLMIKIFNNVNGQLAQ